MSPREIVICNPFADGIAVASVAGTLVSRSGYLDPPSGLRSYADIGDAIATIARAVTAVRNQDELSEHTRPAVAVFDGDDAAEERFDQPAHSGRVPNLIEMAPEVLILLGALSERVGTALNELRARLIQTVLTDAPLAALVGANGRVRYVGCSTHLGQGQSMEGSMGVQFAFAYVLRPEQL